MEYTNIHSLTKVCYTMFYGRDDADDDANDDDDDDHDSDQVAAGEDEEDDDTQQRDPSRRIPESLISNPGTTST